MRRRAVLVGLLSLSLAVTTLAQYGHPLKGSWSGDWGPNATTRNRVLLEFHWDGKALTGAVNPGAPDAATFTKATAEPVVPTYDAWNVHVEATGKGGPIVIDGKVINLGSYNRTMSGTWTEGGKKGDFKVTRN
jgi:hypothetical protein